MRAIQLIRQKGFSLIELMVVAAVFTIITGAVFTVLIVAEQRYKTESEVLNSFNGANVAMDQITRDIHQAGFPPANSYAVGVVPNPSNVALPFAWRGVAGYPAATCTMGAGGSCAGIPGDYDIIVEEDPDPTAPGAAVDWIRYQLPAASHTLLRAVVQKTNGGPAGKTIGSLVPYLDGVMNNATPTEMATIKQYYPNMFPGNVQVPIFTYYCDSAAGPTLCTGANTPLDIREVQITLIVQTSAPDMRNRVPRIVTLTGQAERINPNQ
ncbi:MAG TPA: prepilin-type N-terminal cleavage/methylation domain-containing protein [Candidatus Acidoferrales bacterium]|nr:prepilin-type N-terminal cleavage/methylation domain-containing protein [Candidatus Acidoferrales bacterium]